MTERPLLQLVRNPGSGSHDPSLIAAIASALETKGFEVELATSSAQERFEPNMNAAHVCVAGGDGTVRHVAAALSAMNPPPSFSVYPMGTINLVAREWNAPRDPVAFANHVVDQADIRRLTVIQINDTHFVACASIGPDSDAVALVSERLKARIGRTAYAVSLAKALFRWKAPKLSVKIDGRMFECGAVYISNGCFFGGPWVIAPKARLRDPSLQITMLRRASRLDFLSFLAAVLFKKTASLSNVQIVEGCSVQISSDKPLTIQLDGDVGTSLPATLSVTAASLRG
jgi:diacylglycerol kinase (ATP)